MIVHEHAFPEGQNASFALLTVSRNDGILKNNALLYHEGCVQWRKQLNLVEMRDKHNGKRNYDGKPDR